MVDHPSVPVAWVFPRPTFTPLPQGIRHHQALLHAELHESTTHLRAFDLGPVSYCRGKLIPFPQHATPVLGIPLKYSIPTFLEVLAFQLEPTLSSKTQAPGLRLAKIHLGCPWEIKTG